MLHEQAHGQGGGERDSASATAHGWGQQVARRWPIVVIIILLSTSFAVVRSSAAETTYTGRASLIVASPNRAPEQDAVLVQGYVSYFNDSAYQAQLVQQARLTGSVSLTARAAASSPILLIEATSTSADQAASSATTVARVFQSDINATKDAEQNTQIENLQARIDDAEEQGDDATADSLRQRISEVRLDTTNKLQELQFDGGVSVNAPDRVTSVLLALVGGLLVGVDVGPESGTGTDAS